MFSVGEQRGLLRWLLRELSTDEEDMIAFVTSVADSDDDDAQALLEELALYRSEATPGPPRALYQDERQLIKPREALLALDIPRASFYALLKRGAFPRPLQIDDAWAGWPRDIVLEWADPSARERLATAPSSGHAPFERYGARGLD